MIEDDVQLSTLVSELTLDEIEGTNDSSVSSSNISISDSFSKRKNPFAVDRSMSDVHDNV